MKTTAPETVPEATAGGNDGQRAGRTAASDDEFTGMEQWCLPSRRQHAGRLESEPADAAGLISDKLKKASRKMAQRRRKALSYLRRWTYMDG